MQCVPLNVQCVYSRGITYKNFIIATKLICTINFLKMFTQSGWDSIVSIATCYGLHSLGSYPGGMRLYVLSRLESRPTKPPIQWVPGHTWGGGLEQPGHSGDHPPFSSTGLWMGRSCTSTSPLCLYSHVMGWCVPFITYIAKFSEIKGFLWHFHDYD
jgi:hypothetical protein